MTLSACGGEPTATPGAGGSTTDATATTATGSTGGEVMTPTEPAAQATTAPSGGTGAAPKDNHPNTIIEASAGEPESLDPSWAYDTVSSEIIMQVYETLLFMKKDKTDEFVPMLAEKLPDISQDGKTYTFTIRKGVKFHNGEDLTPEDVAYSLWRGMIQDRSGGPQWIMLQPFFGLDVLGFKSDVVTKQNGGNFAQACEAVKKAVTFDNSANTVTLHLNAPYGPMQQILTGSWSAVVSKSWVTAQKGWDGDCANAEKFADPKAEADELFKAMNGTGPYKLDRWASGEEVDLARNDAYWLKTPLWDGGPSGPAKIERVVIKNVQEWGTRFASFKTGDVDIVQVDQQYISQADPLVKEKCEYGKDCAATNNANAFARVYTRMPSVAAGAIFFNQEVNTTGGNARIGSGKLDGKGYPPNFFSDIHIRKAFAYSFDWDTLIKDIYSGEAEQALGPVINGVLGYDAKQAHYSLDLAKAAEEFKASTMKSESGQSVWDTGFTIQYVYNEGNDQRKVAGEILKDSMSQINPKFNIEIQSEPWPAFLKETNEGRLGLFYLGWQEDFHDPHDWVFPYLSSGGTYAAQQHFDKTLQAQLDDLITKAVQATDKNERVKLYGQLQNLAYENVLDVFTVQAQARHYEQSWVKGFYYNPIYPPNSGVGLYFYALSKGQ
jgi:peptide/nickel transport system substrate-binding protein